MGLKSFIKKFFSDNLFNPKWTCLVCGKEIFNDGYFCEDCLKELPFNDKCICDHCGRATLVPEEYCLTCKEKLLSLDKARSVFLYKGVIKRLIKKMKKQENGYLAEIFAERLAHIYFKNLFYADIVLYVPMTKKRERKNGYNHGKNLAEEFAKRTNLSVGDLLVKVKETKKQALLSAKERRENLKSSFKLTDNKSVKDKSVILIDDVTTTGSTAETIAELLKKKGAKQVILLTVASVKAKTGI